MSYSQTDATQMADGTVMSTVCFVITENELEIKTNLHGFSQLRPSSLYEAVDVELSFFYQSEKLLFKQLILLYCPYMICVLRARMDCLVSRLTRSLAHYQKTCQLASKRRNDLALLLTHTSLMKKFLGRKIQRFVVAMYHLICLCFVLCFYVSVAIIGQTLYLFVEL